MKRTQKDRGFGYLKAIDYPQEIVNIPTEAQLRVKVSEMTKHEFIALRDELESNWSESYRPLMNLLSLTSIIKFNTVLTKLNKETYRMYVIDSNESDFDKFHTSYEEVKKLAFGYKESNDYESLLRCLVKGLNDHEYSDQNWYFITEESEGIIIIS
jgi:hypothetical protein